MANRSPKPSSYASPGGGTPRSLVGSLHLGNLQSFLIHLKDEETLRVVGQRRKSQHKVQQRELVQAILEDQEQWEKLHQAMKKQRSGYCTSMGLTQNLRELIQDRIEDMEATGTYCSSSSMGSNRSRLNSSSSC